MIIDVPISQTIKRHVCDNCKTATYDEAPNETDYCMGSFSINIIVNDEVKHFVVKDICEDCAEEMASLVEAFLDEEYPGVISEI